MRRNRLRSTHVVLLLLSLMVGLLASCGTQSGTPAASAPTVAAPAPTNAAPAATNVTPPATLPAATEQAATPPPPTEPPVVVAPTEAPTAAEPAAAGDKVMRVHVITYPDVVDPQKSSFASEISILSLAYEGLTRLDKDLKAVPGAAESWEFNATGDVITFTLRAGLTYSDGTPLTAENFRYAVERTCDPQTAGEYQSILFEIIGCADWATTPVTDTAAYDTGKAGLAKGVQAVDERTLVLRLTNPAPYYVYIAGLWVMYPAKQALIEAGGEDWWKDPQNHVGNGPFTITQMAEDQLVSFIRNPTYWGGQPKLDGLDFVFIKDTSVALEAYKANQVEVLAIDPSQIPAIKGDPVLSKELLSYAGASSYAWGFNLTKEPFQDKKVREAFAYALDRQTLCEVIRNGDCIAALSWVPQGINGSIQSDRYAFDPAKAKQALAESSYGGPDKLPEIKLTYNSDDPAAQPRIEWIAGQLRDILGINITLDPTDGKTLSALRKNAETYPQACPFCANWFQDYPDPQNWLSLLWTCQSTFAQRIGYCNAKFDEVAQQADAELDTAKRKALYEQASQILLDDLPAPQAYNLAVVLLVKPEVVGYQTTPADVQWPGQWGSAMSVDLNR